MTSRADIAEMIFPEVKESIADLQKKYPARSNPICSRFAPSPTGFLHIGWIYASFVEWKFAKQNWGTFFLRIEDTDQKREVEGAVDLIISWLKFFGIQIDEWPIGEHNADVGNYWPYTQSQRKYMYNVFVKYLIQQWLAYPCWMSEGELNTIREQQTKTKVTPGIYGNYSIWRSKSPEEIVAKIAEDENYVIRFRSHGDLTKRIVFEDVIKWKIEMIDNYNDIVLIKWDGLPTYHLAHIADDHLMRTSHVIRGEERLTSVPLHIQLFKAFDLPIPHYCHPASLLKLEDGNKRKLSKRKDPEADITYFFVHWYTPQGIIEYLINIADSSFEDWQKANPDKSYLDFDIKLEKMSKSGALFDLVKLQSVNNAYISKLSTDELYEQTLRWAKQYKTDLVPLLTSDVDYVKAAINIERHSPKDPKRFTTYMDVDSQIRFFFDDERAKMEKPALPEMFTPDVIKNFVTEYTQVLDLDATVEERFEQLKQIGKKYWFATNNAEFKEWWYIWKIGDLAMFLRIQLCGSPKSPDLYSVMKVMGKDRVTKRLAIK